MVQKLITILKKYFFSDKLYSKNMAFVFILLFLSLVSLFSSKKVSYYAQNIKISYIKNIFSSIVEPFISTSKEMGFENFFTNSRNSLLETVGVSKDYHWETQYYEAKPTYLFTNNLNTNISSLEPKTLNPLNANPPFKNTPQALNNADETTEENKLLLMPYDYTSKKPIRILCLGDSLMQSLAEGLKRTVEPSTTFDITDIAVVSSGFIRTDYYNWPGKLTSIFETANNENKPYDVAVLILGMNDNQNFFDGNGTLYRFGTDEWIQGYSKKIKAVIDILEKHVKKIYWLGLPIVKSSSLNNAISIIEAAQVNISKELNTTNLTHLPLRNITNTATYTSSITDSQGKRIPFMKDDGTHYTLSGATFLMQTLKERLYQDFKIEPYIP